MNIPIANRPLNSFTFCRRYYYYFFYCCPLLLTRLLINGRQSVARWETKQLITVFVLTFVLLIIQYFWDTLIFCSVFILIALRNWIFFDVIFVLFSRSFSSIVYGPSLVGAYLLFLIYLLTYLLYIRTPVLYLHFTILKCLRRSQTRLK